MCNDLPDDMLELIAEYSNASASDMLECKNWLLPQTFGKVEQTELGGSRWILSNVKNIRFEIQSIHDFKADDGYTQIKNTDYLQRFGRPEYVNLPHIPFEDRDLARHTLLQFLISDNGEDRVRIWTNETEGDYWTVESVKLIHFWFLPLQEEFPENVLHVTVGYKQIFYSDDRFEDRSSNTYFDSNDLTN